ncbi:hypothetical protein EYF80_053246 [Liparis tanakae]|uniref:Uncharacterized protein n=1 Tax=Liparis tanakae TaxID=230148 RepID=A0A4Z2F618_9TELE|nr:hypothetical protein EYF80_053246 [Liparis tanakae]
MEPQTGTGMVLLEHLFIPRGPEDRKDEGTTKKEEDPKTVPSQIPPQTSALGQSRPPGSGPVLWVRVAQMYEAFIFIRPAMRGPVMLTSCWTSGRHEGTSDADFLLDIRTP